MAASGGHQWRNNAQKRALPSDCKRCKEIEKEMNRATKQVCTVQFKNDVIYDVTSGKKEEKDEMKNNFLETVNALINEGGGLIYIHTNHPGLLDKFRQISEDKLQKMIPESELSYSDNFESCQRDSKHFVFEVKPRKRIFISTANFNSKMSRESCLVDVSHARMKYLVEKAKIGVAAVGRGGGGGGDLRVQNGTIFLGKCIFQESCKVQAKSIPEDQRANVEKFVEYACTKLKHGYITAFCQEDFGGSIYFGLSEGEGGFLWEGVRLSEQDKRDISQKLKDYCVNDMMWLTHNRPRDPIAVMFRDNQQGTFVIEVAVKELEGVSFFEKDGPRAYRLDPKTNTPTRIAIDVWTRSYGNTITAHKPEFSENLH